MIRGMEGLYNTDHNPVMYSHAGLIIDETGTTFESYWTVTRHNMFDRYTGHDILIARYNQINDIKFDHGFECIAKHEGEFYPIQRLLFYAFGVAKMVHWKKYVCSELVARYLHEVCKWDLIFDFEEYFGMTPDNVMDVIRSQPRYFDVVYEGTL